jgi:tetratricopeptide (TPR) repeat protein
LLALFGGAIWVHERNLPAVHYGRAIELIQAGQMNQGISEMEQAVALNSNLLFPSALLGELQLQLGNPSAAVPVLEHTMKVVPAYFVAHNLALAYLGSGQSAQAMSEIGAAMKFEKTDLWRAQFIVGLAAEQSGDSKLAAESFRWVAQANPDFPDAQQALLRLRSAESAGNSTGIPYSKLIFKSEAWPIYP